MCRHSSPCAQIARIGLLFCLFALAACATAPQAAATPTDEVPGKLGDILARGTLSIATDSNYPPQSKLIPNVARAANTKCANSEQTANQFAGFDVDVGSEVARRLGVEPCFVSPAWTQLISGNWDDRWDISVSSMAITPERLKVLYFTPPYYVTPAVLFIHQDNQVFQQPSDLSGKRVGVCAGCTYEAYLDGTLKLIEQEIKFVIKQPLIVGYDIESSALQDLAAGDGLKLDAVLTGIPVGEYLRKGGLPVKQLGEPVYAEFLSIAMDRKSRLDQAAFVRKVSEIIQQMHTDGTLLKLSQQHYQVDLATAASQFDARILGQYP